MARRNMQILTEIGHMLEGAGSNKAQITMTHAQVEQLGLLNHRGKATITVLGGMDNEGKALMQPQDSEVPAVIPHGEVLSGFTVVVGVARAALNKILKGRPVEGMLQPEDGRPRSSPLEDDEEVEETEDSELGTK